MVPVTSHFHKVIDCWQDLSKKTIHRVYQNLVYRKEPEGAFVKKYHYRSSYGPHSVPLPLTVFLLTSFSVCSLHGPHKMNATGPDEFFTCATRLEGTCKFSYRLQYSLQLTVPRVACKEKAVPCKFFAVQKFVKGVIVLTRVGTFSIILLSLIEVVHLEVYSHWVPFCLLV